MNDSQLSRLVENPPGVASLEFTTPPAEELEPVDGLLAGAAEVDITPPPGLPKSGHSKNAHDGDGFRTRLRARVIHLRAGRTSVALVASDLLGGSAVLNQLVAKAVADDTDVRLPGLFMGYTHTHAGPGQFNGCDFYNTWASNRPGFDPAWTRFLADRISGAIRDAVATRRPARLATGSTEVWGFTRNRSLDAHVRNESVSDKRIQRHRGYTAINPWLHLLRVDTDDGPLAALSVFSIHGTGISHSDRSYNADVWAYLNDRLAQRISEATGARAVVGAVEGTHGDMTPAVVPGQLVFPEVKRIGHGIGDAAADLHERLEPELTGAVELAAGLRDIDLDADPELDGVTLPYPAVGMAKLAGARENTSPVLPLLPPFRPGYPKPRTRGPHGEKWIVGARRLREWKMPPDGFPRVLPVQILRIGGFALTGLPFEITVEAGRCIERAVAEAVDAERVAVSSLANDHWDYLTTAEEYTRQAYEGASNIYGPHTLRFVSAAARDLAADLAKHGAVADHLPVRRFSLHTHRYLPSPSGVRAGRAVLRPARFTEMTVGEEAFWELRWSDVAPGDLRWHEPLVRVEASDDGVSWRTVADDQGTDVGVHYLGAHGGRHRYAARWFGPDLVAGRTHRFVLLANAGQPELAGDPFD